MIIAAAINTENENMFWHFGHCERFKMYTIENNEVIKTDYLTVTGGHGPQRLEAMINAEANVIISDGQGPGIADQARDLGIEIIAGVQMDADTAVKMYLAGQLKNDPAGVHPCGQD